MDHPAVLLLALGGTIAMQAGQTQGVVPTLTAEALIAAVPQLADVASVDACSFRQLPGAHLTFDDIEALAQRIELAAAQGVRGVVVTQGTDTIEEAAFALDCLLRLDMPVVVTGAMRNPTVPGADGPANVLAAVQVAVSEAARGLGCLVMMNDEVHAARFVRKTHTASTAAFASPGLGPLGSVTEGRVRIATRVLRLPVLPAVGNPQTAKVALATIALGDDETAVRALRVCGGIDGLVVQGTGGGHVPPSVAQELQIAAQEMPVVLASRVLAGEVLAHTYGFSGSEIDLIKRGLIRSGWLDGLKARVLLTLLLRRGAKDGAAAAFEAWQT